MSDVTKELLEALKKCRNRFALYVEHHKAKGDSVKAVENGHFVAIADEAIARAEAALAELQPNAGLIGVQWWLAELDRYNNATLVDGKHSDRAGADEAMYLFRAMHLDDGRRYAVARVELSEPKPCGDGVNHEAIKTLKDARREAQP